MGIILTLVLVCCVFLSFGQAKPQAAPPGEPVQRPLTVSLLSNYYDQDGEHGAVNGGIGSQKLESYTQEAHIYVPVKELSGLRINGGADHFTSASLRLIDKYKTSASAAQGDVSGDETRVFGSIGYDFGNKAAHTITSLGLGYSKEYDVNAYSFNFGWNKDMPARNLNYQFGLSLVADRWLVIYPGEFRSQVTGYADEGGHSGGSGGSGGSGHSGDDDDDDHHGSGHSDDDDDDSGTDGHSGASVVDSSGNGQIPVGYAKPIPVNGKTATKNGKTFPVDWRYSINLTNKLSYVINQRMNGAVGIDLTFQSGLLSTPFYRVYFNDGVVNELDKEVRIEKLPRLRYRAAVYGRYDYQVTRYLGLRTMARYYADNWGIQGLTASVEVPVKIGSACSINPFYRIALQQGSKYFAGYAEHVYTPESFYTSDYDLGSFTAHKVGGAIRISPLNSVAGIRNEEGTRYLFSLASVGLRYAYYMRSDGLRAHSASLELNFSF